jgi:hypothetical protein
MRNASLKIRRPSVLCVNVKRIEVPRISRERQHIGFIDIALELG